MPGVRKSYSIEYKQAVIEEYKRSGKTIVAFCHDKNLSDRIFRRWRQDVNKFSLLATYGHGKKQKVGSGRQPLCPELEDVLFDWIIDQRARAYVVKRADIQKKAIELAPSFDLHFNFKASATWLDHFLSRHHLSIRRSTTLFKLDDEQVITRALSFKRFIDNIDFSNYQLSNIVAMDETAVFMGEKSQTTIDHVGASSIYIPSTGYESERVTCILAIRLDKSKVTPLIISKGTRERIVLINGINVIETEKAWATQGVIRKWVESTLPLISRGRARGMVIWDSASTHRAKGIKKFLAQRRVDQIMIPAGMTGYLQTLDIVINKPFKDVLRAQMNDYISNRLRRNERGNFIKPSLEEIAGWVKNAWFSISEETVANALKAGYLDKSYGFEDSYIGKHERLGQLIRKELGVQENLRDLSDDVYTDILEEDDVAAVFE